MTKKKTTRSVFSPIQQFFEGEIIGGVILIFCTVIAMVWANSMFSEFYYHMLELPIQIKIGTINIDKPLEFWINDLLMAIFFLYVASEIKIEMIAGELSDIKRASLPIAAAVGGMLVPGLIYFLFNRNDIGAHGWGIPTATDIAFSLGVLALLGKRAPFSLKVFLTALAIVDDLGAVLVIAIFYTGKLNVTYLLITAVVFGVILLINKLKVYSMIAYMVLGLILWYCVYQSGIHATIAGVLLAIAMPARRKVKDENTFTKRVMDGIQNFRNSRPNEKDFFLSKEQSTAVYSISEACEDFNSPQIRLIDALHPWIAFFIMPVFAIANAGINLNVDFGEAMTNTVTLGIILGLFAGKQIGVFLMTFIMVKLKLGSLPDGLSWKHIYGISVLAGIGFTMSLFVSQLAFTGLPSADRLLLLNDAKIGIIAGSLISGLWGYFFLRMINQKVN